MLRIIFTYDALGSDLVFKLYDVTYSVLGSYGLNLNKKKLHKLKNILLCNSNHQKKMMLKRV
jgi:hypothetical protein